MLKIPKKEMQMLAKRLEYLLAVGSQNNFAVEMSGFFPISGCFQCEGSCESSCSGSCDGSCSGGCQGSCHGYGPLA